MLDAAGAPFEYVDLEAGFELFQRTGVALPEKTLHTLKQCTGSVFGAVRCAWPVPFAPSLSPLAPSCPPAPSCLHAPSCPLAP